MATRIQLYLASTSPRRQELLRQIGVSFSTLSVEIDETVRAGEQAQDFVTRIARQKAMAGWHHPERSRQLPVLGSDTAVVVDRQIYGKPRDYHHAVEMLSRLSGRCHQVMTAVALVLGQRTEVRLNVSEVCFRQLSMAEIEAYWDSGEPRDKAGAYAIQGLGALFVRQLQGSYSGVMGLPIYETAELLQQYGVKLLRSEDRRETSFADDRNGRS